MIYLPGYRILEKHLEEISWTLYKAYSIEEDKMVGLKILNNDDKKVRVAEVIHDYHMTKSLLHDSVLQPIGLERHGNEAYMVTELFSGITVREWLEKGLPDLHTFLKVALKISDILALIHQEHIIHKSLQPQNILINPRTNELKVTGFDQATTLSEETEQPHITPYHLQVQVSYWSPEQTGRMNRSLDYRTDLYSLGIIFYEMLTGVVPFIRDNHAEIIHAHLAILPKAPSEVSSVLPLQLSNIIMKLLEKSPEMRYQSVYGLKADLEKCLQQLQHNKQINPFVLGEKDVTTMLERPQKLFGREDAIHQLVVKFQQFKKGSRELLLISGPSGIGKTVLVKELNKSLIQENGYFISGKFVDLQNGTPYAPLVQAFQGLLRQILSEGSKSIQKWHDILSVELSSYAGVIANFIPEVEWIIGPQAKVLELPAEGTHNRFLLAIKAFVRVFAKAEHPLVLFLDDLQWADRATLDLIQHLLSDTRNQHLLIIGAYRDNEVPVGHPFEVMLKNIKEKDIQITTITMKPLDVLHIKEWIDDVFMIEQTEASILYQYVDRITQGNPFFIVQLLQSFYDEKIVNFRLASGMWQVNLNHLHDLSMTDTIIDYIVKRLDKLPVETKEVLQFASCLGNKFDLKLLATITMDDYAVIAKKLWYGLEEGIILPLDTRYKWVYPNENIPLINEQPPTYQFLHDKVLQAIYMTMSVEKREQYHLQIGNVLLDSYDDDQREEHIFEIVNHLNISQHYLSLERKLALADWNRMAGEKAKDSAALDAALTFFNTGKELLPANCWDAIYYETTIKIMIGLGEAQYLTRNFDKAEETFDDILVHAQSLREEVRVYNLKIMLYIHIHQVEKATREGLKGLRLFKWNIKENPNKWAVAKEYMLTKLALLKNKRVDLLRLPAVTEENPRLAMRTLINTNAPAYHVNQNLATVLMLRALRLTLKYGDMDVTALVYNNYALTLSAGFNDYEGSYQFGQLAIEHAEKYQDRSLKARVYFVFGSFINHWKRHIRYNIDYLEQSQQMCIESGNLHIAGANASFIGIILFIKGDNLRTVADGIDRQLTFARQNECVLPDDFLGEMINWTGVLSNKNKEINWNQSEFTDDPSATIIHNTFRLQMTYLLQNESEAIKIMDKMEKLVDDTLILVVAPEYYFYYCLWIAKLIRNQVISLKKGKKKVDKKITKLKQWAHHSPDNYLHQYLLVKAEMASVSGINKVAIHLYGRSILLAEENGFLQDTAIANECAAHYYLAEGLPKSAKAYMVDAYLYYLKWGANRVADNLLQQYPKLIRENGHHATALSTGNESLDLHAIFQVAAVITGEINFDQLVVKMMHTMLTHGGAERAILLLGKEGGLQVVASNHVNTDIHVYPERKNIENYEHLPIKIIDYVVNSQEDVVLGDASQKGEFIKDTYILKNKVKSILCLPILYQGKLTGILYLENNQSSYAFTNDRIDLLTLLASQAAVSIENAYLYGHLEEEVKERTRLLNEVNKNLMSANHSLAQSREERLNLFANISHDLRSPIATIRGYIDAILDGLVEQPEQQRHYLQVAKIRLSSLNGLIQDLFDLAQLESGNNRFTMDVMPLDQLFTHLCSQFELEVEQANLNYQWELPLSTNSQYPLAEVDVGRMEQVLTNLISNAIKHTKEGSIRISLSIEKEDQAIISVEDDGSGIPESELPYVFDRFYTKKRSSKQQGHGLGLVISKEIITHHRGDIRVTSQEGKGTIFSISLPIFDID